MVLKLFRMRHPRLILKDERNIVFAQHVKQPGFQPILVPDLDREPIIGDARQLFKERPQPRLELHRGRKERVIEERKLKDHRSKLFLKHVYRGDEFLKLFVTIDEHLLMRDRSRDLQRKQQ